VGIHQLNPQPTRKEGHMLEAIMQFAKILLIILIMAAVGAATN